MAHLQRTLFIWLSAVFIGYSSAGIRINRGFLFPQLNINGLGIGHSENNAPHSSPQELNTYTNTAVLTGPLGLGSLSISTSHNVLGLGDSNKKASGSQSELNVPRPNCNGANSNQHQSTTNQRHSIGLNLLFGNNSPNPSSSHSNSDCSPGTGTNHETYSTTSPDSSSTSFQLAFENNRTTHYQSTHQPEIHPTTPPTNPNQHLNTISTTANIDELIAEVYNTPTSEATPNVNKRDEIYQTDREQFGAGVLDVRVKPSHS